MRFFNTGPIIDAFASGGPWRTQAPVVNLDEVLAGLADDNVYAPEGDVEAFRDIVAGAAEQGIDLKIVAFPYNPWYGGGPRDLANDIGASEGGTVLVLGPDVVGTYSDSISRFTLEGAQMEIVRQEHPDAAAIFLEQITSSGFPWTGVTVGLLLFVAAVVVGTRWWTRRGYQADSSEDASAARQRAEHGFGEEGSERPAGGASN